MREPKLAQQNVKIEMDDLQRLDISYYIVNIHKANGGPRRKMNDADTPGVLGFR